MDRKQKTRSEACWSIGVLTAALLIQDSIAAPALADAKGEAAKIAASCRIPGASLSKTETNCLELSLAAKETAESAPDHQSRCRMLFVAAASMAQAGVWAKKLGSDRWTREEELARDALADVVDSCASYSEDARILLRKIAHMELDG